jgi:hypothetical protein
MGEGPPRSSIVRAHYRLATVLRWRYSSLEREWGGGGAEEPVGLFSLSPRLPLPACCAYITDPSYQLMPHCGHSGKSPRPHP